MGLSWEEVDVQQISRRSGGKYASINEGRIALSPEACEMVKDVYDYPYVNIRIARNDNFKVEKVAINFAKQKTDKTIDVSRRKYKGEVIDGLNINSKQLVALIFGDSKNKKTTRYAVEVGGDLTLIIDVTREV